MNILYSILFRFRHKLIFPVLIFIFLFTNYGLVAQRGECLEITNQEAIKFYQEALGKPAYKIKEALVLLEKAIALEPNFVDAYYKHGELCYTYAYRMFHDTVFITRSDPYFNQAEKSFLKVVGLCNSFNYYMSNFYLGQFYYHVREFEKSDFFLGKFIQHNNENTRFYHDAKNMLKNVKLYLELINNPVPFNPEPLMHVCSSNDEYLPLISPDEEILFYSYRYKKNPNTAFEEYVEELVVSNRIWEDSAQMTFTKGIPMPAPFNDGRNQGGATITIDNNHLYITICEFERAEYTSYKNCDIFSSDFVNGKWTILKRLGKEINNINTFEGMPSITADGKVLFFASAREGGYGGLDIYKSVKDKDGNWGKAENLGPVINTAGDDKTPFIHSDSQTLYFSSNGRFGLGGFDVFYSRYYGNGQWSEPKNMGYPINTLNDEVGMMVSTNGKQIFFSSRAFNKDGNWDIYTASLYEEARPKKVLFVKGKLTDDNGREVTNALVGLTNLESREFTEGLVDEHSGKYAVAVPVKKDEDYLLTVKKDDYFFNSKLINPNDKEFDPPTTVDLKISKVEKNKPIRLENVNFEIDSYQLDDAGKANINLLVEFMKANPEIKITLHGHTDNMGSTIYNEELSQRRVKSVRDYMVSQGITSARISFRGFGEKRPIADNSTKNGRALNRRVEFIIK
jgi:outer membrane protein OmpA-like peptidoglycan-associated protein/tetratricopeptide (TPR) repeat protein